MENLLSPSTIIWVLFIVAVFFICLFFVSKFQKEDKLVSNRRIIEYFPTAVSTLGVLGTFWGITQGLLAFDSSNLDQSIPELLNGLKTAFFTSLAGMIGSMILSAIINKKQDEKDGGISDSNQAAVSICNAVSSLAKQMHESEKDRMAFYRSMGDVMDKVKESQQSLTTAIDSIVTLQRSQEGAISQMKENSSAMANSIGNLEEQSTNQTQALSLILTSTRETAESTHHMGDLTDDVSSIYSVQENMFAEVKQLKEIIHGEVVAIEDSMDKTNQLLEKKFDEFTELLKKSNTEALVEVMKRVTEEFQKQMNSLINKLIQENFEQLNKSVEKLNTWQQENKAMITQLTKQYKEMADNFEDTSTSLTKVKEDTTSLVSEGGKLRQLVDALNEVIVKDEKFLEISNNLQKTADLSKSNMESFDESTKALNDWVRKQRHFVDGVTLLIQKLEELNKIRDYGEQFWKGTKANMEEGVNIIKQGSVTLNSELRNIDSQFYNRLNQTLGELDNCITQMAEKVFKRR